MTARFGFCAVVGRPNVGKSTLVNGLCGMKIAIVSDVAQTTRSALRGVLNTDAGQLVLVDTPGIHKPATLLGERLNELAHRTLREVDVVAFVVDVRSGIGRGDRLLAESLPGDMPVVCVLNKTDVTKPARIAEQIQTATELRDFDAYVPLSALTGDGLDLLVGELVERLPEGEAMFPPDMPTDQTETHMIAELVREKLLAATRDEVPHSIAVVVDEVSGLDDPDATVRVDCIVYVERESQKGIVIGRGGARLRDAGTQARAEIEALLGRHVYLDVRVKVSRQWQQRADRLARLGY